MFVTVIIPVFNAAKYIERAVHSVLLQSEVTELILVDDGSKDNSLSICNKLKELDNRIKILHHVGNKNKGVSATRNVGIKKASNDFIAFLDADDYYLPDRFKQTKECFNSDSSADGVYEAIAIHGNEKDLRNFNLTKYIDPLLLFNGISPIGTEGWFSADGLTVRKSIFDKCGFFDEDLKTSEDTLLWLKMAATSKLIAGNYNAAVTITERVVTSLSSNKSEVEKNQIRMLYKLYYWLKDSKSLINERGQKKELVLSSIIELTVEWNKDLTKKYFNTLKIILKIGFVDFIFLIKSKRFRRLVGNILHFKK